MSDLDLRAWRELPLSAVTILASSIVLGGMVFITTTRLNILPGDPLIIGYFDGSGSNLRQALFLCGVLVMIVIGHPFSRPWELVRLPAAMALLLSWCVLSISWSETPDVAARRLLLTVIVIWLCFRTVDQLGHRRAMDVLLMVCIGLLCANLAAVALFADAVHHNQGVLKDDSIVGAWRGILPEKNGAGQLSAVTVLLLLFGVGRWRAWVRIALIVAAMAFLVGSHSKTSMAFAGFAALCGGLFLIGERRLRPLLVPALLVSLPVVICAATVYLPGYFQRLGSSLDAFTGRIQIWRIMAAYIAAHGWTGAGFASVWNVGPQSPIYSYSNVPWVTKAVAEGHDGYLDLWMQIGLPGLLLACVALFALPLGNILCSRAVAGERGALQLALLLFAMGHNLLESSILASDQFGEMMLMLSIACIDDMRRGARIAHPVSYAPAWHEALVAVQQDVAR